MDPDAPVGADRPITPDGPVAPLGDIADELAAIPGLTVTDDAARPPILRDDLRPAGRSPRPGRATLHPAPVAAPSRLRRADGRLQQRLLGSTRPFRSQVTAIVGGNQLSMEHRYFLPSRPSPTDWSKLDIWGYPPADQHRITATLQERLYQGKWLTTGASKGGMTSLFHRRFYPDDVDATVAYVAPVDYAEDAIVSPTNRYLRFLEQVGTNPACRQRLKDFQNLVLARREAMKPRMRAEANFTELLGEDRSPSSSRPSSCRSSSGSTAAPGRLRGRNPGATASDDEVFAFFNSTIAVVAAYGDDDLTAFLPYYQPVGVAARLPDQPEPPGGPAVQQAEHRGRVPASLGAGPDLRRRCGHARRPGLAVDQQQRLMFIYGEYDPWSRRPSKLGRAVDSWKYIAPQGNHGSSITSLTTADRDAAADTVRRWAGVSASRALALDPTERTAEQEDLEFARRHRRR